MKYVRFDDGIREHISYLIAVEHHSKEEAVEIANRHRVLTDMIVRVMIRKCKVEGHKIKDDSYGNAESGCIDMTCTRCGWHHHSRLY